VSTKIFPTAQDAESAFYEALERGDYETMVAVWAEDEEVLCVHPGGPRLRGTDEVLAQWKRIFEGGQRLQVRISHQVVIAGLMIAVHSVQENIVIEGEGPAPHPVVATNVYQRIGAGWRMVAHHASPAPTPSAPPPTENRLPGSATLH
jgi:ketosteroid isomerase-like protein